MKIWKTAYFFEIAAILNILTILFYPKCTTVVFIVLLDLKNMGFVTKIRSLRCAWADIWAIVNLQFCGGHFEKWSKWRVHPRIFSVNILILDQKSSLNKMIPLVEDPGGVHGNRAFGETWRSKGFCWTINRSYLFVYCNTTCPSH